ncbi:MAG: hypothetical protein RLZZ317_1041 [Actinomycetota bacterium]|jgi:hypothetical protein
MSPGLNSSSHDRPSAVGRRCTRSGCSSHAARTLTYIYSDSTAVLGPLSTYAEPHAYDLCTEHSEKLKVPNGWTVIAHDPELHQQEPSPDDVLAIAEAIRQTAKIDLAPKPITPEVGRRGHLRAIPRHTHVQESSHLDN